MSDGEFPRPTLRLIIESLIAGFDGLAVDDHAQLAADLNPDNIDAVSDDVLPFLLFDIGSIQIAPWQFWQDSIAWDLPAKLKVKTSSGEVETYLLEVLQQLMQRTAELIGLPIDQDGHVVPFTPATAYRFDRGELAFLAERGAPFLRSMSVRPAQGSYATADLMWHIETTLDHDPRGELPVALQMRLGILPMQGSLAADPTLPEPLGIPITPSSAVRGIGGYNTPDPLGRTRRPPLRQAVGVADSDRVTAVNVTPYATTLTAGAPTAQLASIATYANWNTAHVEQLGAWVSADQSVATVSSAGVITRVGVGATTCTITFGGVVSNVVAITCT